MSIERVIENYINGNLTDAKQGAKRYSQVKISDYLEDIGYGITKSFIISQYLKGKVEFQKHCDLIEKL